MASGGSSPTKRFQADPNGPLLLSYATLKEGFDAHANEYGYIRTSDKEAFGNLALFLGQDADVVEREMKAIDFDSNGHVSFAEFALWADRHTVGVPLGIDVPDKREWRKGLPSYWTSVPPEEEASSAPSPTGRGRGRSRTAIPETPDEEEPDNGELEALMSAAKDFVWDTVWEILARIPRYVNMRPPYRRYAAIHQAAFCGDVEILRRYVEEFGGDPELLSKDGESPEQVARQHGKTAAAEFLAAKVAEKPELLQRVNGLIECAKWGHWEFLFDGLAAYPAAINLRPPERRWAIIHQAAFAGRVDVLRRLVEARADPRLLTRDQETALQIAKARSKGEAAEFLASLERNGGGGPGEGGLIEQAHKVIDAAKTAHWEETFQLLDAGPGGLVNMRPAVREWGVLHQAAFHGDMEVLRTLIEKYNADVKMPTKDGQSALEIARSANQQAAAKYLEACIPSIVLDDDFVHYPEQEFVQVTEPEDWHRFFVLLDFTHKRTNNWTRDRLLASGKPEPDKKTPVPKGYELVGVLRNENPALWRVYQVCREITKMQRGKVVPEAAFSPWTPMTMDPANGIDWSNKELCPDANEWLLFHAGLPEALTAIARKGFTMKTLGTGGTTGSGGLYGNGTYFAESITKADEYARGRVGSGDFAGTRAVALCRVLGGRHYYTDKDVTESDKPDFHRRALQGHYHSTVGDRLKLKDTFREYVVYDSSATYLEYIMYYRRLEVPPEHQ